VMRESAYMIRCRKKKKIDRDSGSVMTVLFRFVFSVWSDKCKIFHQKSLTTSTLLIQHTFRRHVRTIRYKAVNVLVLSKNDVHISL
jgi:hypothetical protein